MKALLVILASFLFLTTVRGGEKKKDVKGLSSVIEICAIFVSWSILCKYPMGKNMADVVNNSYHRKAYPQVLRKRCSELFLL